MASNAPKSAFLMLQDQAWLSAKGGSAVLRGGPLKADGRADLQPGSASVQV